MMFCYRSLFIVLLISIVSGCQVAKQDDMTPVQIDTNPDVFNVIEVTNPKTTYSMTVRHMVANGNVFVECYVPDFDFEKEAADENEGHLVVSVDHQKPYPVYKAAFVVKDLSPGKHHIKVKLVGKDRSALKGMEKQFFVNVK
ncbi:hypothetical protein [Pseudalkalibacillus decolorationis]|uniref:hypothetical protein n=1 Tax=Pseudalkalibacillus decolorationis TaxID=163879 RepID=UPI002147DB5F|nr:hypothetical protein [Pseudalkalibacillus decolorationis]